MKFFFADDSSQTCARAGMHKLMAFGGILLSGDALKPLSLAIDEIANTHGFPADEEIKWSPRRGSWMYETLKGEERAKCIDAVLAAALAHECKAIVGLCDPELRNIKPEWGFQRCFQYALERVSNHLTDSHEEAVIIADRPSGGHKEADQFLTSFAEHLASTHNHMLEETVALNLLTAPSHMVRHLQVADLVVAITTAMFAGQTKWAASHFKRVRSMFITNRHGLIGGTGVKVYPDKLINLYHWVLGEDNYSKVGVMYPLPASKALFAKNDGLEV